MAVHSAGILLYRVLNGHAEVFLVHPGGPFWARKDEGSWTIPKGEYAEGEAPLAAAIREFREETGADLGSLEFTALKPVTQRGGKVVHAFAAEGTLDAAGIVSNTFTLEWPPRSGRHRSFPEVDKAAWFRVDAARTKINPAQEALLSELEALLRSPE